MSKQPGVEAPPGEQPKPKYEPPTVVDLGEVVRAMGVCAGGNGDAESCGGGHAAGIGCGGGGQFIS